MFRKGISILLATLTLFFTILAILGIWDIIDIKNIASKSLYSILIIFVSSAILLFIFSVLYKSEDNNQLPPNNNQ